MDGCEQFNSYPTHISYNKCPKHIISIFSISVVALDHIIAFTLELIPNKPFSKPESLFNNGMIKIKYLNKVYH